MIERRPRLYLKKHPGFRIFSPVERRARPRHLEDQLQRNVIAYWRAKYPQTWAFTFHCPSGIAAKSARLAAIFKGLGTKAGVPDLLCFARRGEYAGLALELKYGRGRPTDAQVAWLRRLESQGWCVQWSNDLAVIGDVLDRYHALPAWRSVPREA